MTISMKCISLKQPYAEFLAIGKKTVESRKWSTGYRGDFLIHASKTIDTEACDYYKININTVTKGAIIGKASLYGIKKYINNLEFALDKDKHFSLKKILNNGCMYGFLIKDPVKFDKTIPCSGKLGFFDVCDSDVWSVI
jgi:hypothetical protein